MGCDDIDFDSPRASIGLEYGRLKRFSPGHELLSLFRQDNGVADLTEQSAAPVFFSRYAEPEKFAGKLTRYYLDLIEAVDREETRGNHYKALA